MRLPLGRKANSEKVASSVVFKRLWTVHACRCVLKTVSSAFETSSARNELYKHTKPILRKDEEAEKARRR